MEVTETVTRWEVERDRFGVHFSGPLEIGECIEVVPVSALSILERWTIPVCSRCNKVLIPTAVSGWCHCAENRDAVATGSQRGMYREVEVVPAPVAP